MSYASLLYFVIDFFSQRTWEQLSLFDSLLHIINQGGYVDITNMCLDSYFNIFFPRFWPFSIVFLLKVHTDIESICIYVCVCETKMLWKMFIFYIQKYRLEHALNVFHSIQIILQFDHT